VCLSLSFLAADAFFASVPSPPSFGASGRRPRRPGSARLKATEAAAGRGGDFWGSPEAKKWVGSDDKPRLDLRGERADETRVAKQHSFCYMNEFLVS
jgi:hypothetical protein